MSKKENIEKIENSEQEGEEDQEQEEDVVADQEEAEELEVDEQDQDQDEDDNQNVFKTEVLNKSKVSIIEPEEESVNHLKEANKAKKPAQASQNSILKPNMNSTLNRSTIPNPILAQNRPPKPQPPKDYELFDFIFPGGKLSKLCKIKNKKNFNKQVPVILEAFKFKEACPSIVMAGSKDSQRGKLLAGVARAAFRSDAVILDSGVASGIENYCLRRSK